METYIRALQVKRQVEERFLHMDGIHGLSIGYEESIKGYSDNVCIYLHLHNLKSVGIIPKSIMGVSTGIIESPIPKPQQDRTVYRPLLGGCRIESSRAVGGTLGCIVNDNTSRKKMALTCQHIFAGESDLVGQPVFDHHSLIQKGKGVLSKKVDAALCSLENVNYKQSILDIGQTAGPYTVSIADIKYEGYPVRKRGMATGMTFGLVKQLNYTGYRADGWRFHDQLWIEGDENVFASEGDSGSVYVDVKNRVVGLHWGGEGYHYGVGCSIEDVMSELNIEIPASIIAKPTSWSPREMIGEFLY